jgi:transcriptional regulator with XRE-family HTH domain
MDVKKKKKAKTMRMKVDDARRITALRNRFAITQARLAEILGVTQPMVSSWEAGRETPSAESWIKLGNLSPWPDSLWFWEQAGLKPSALAATAEKALRELSKPATPELLTDQLVGVPPFKKGADRGTEGRARLVERDYVPNPISTSYYTIDKDSEGYGLNAGDILLIDSSESGSPSLMPFWDQMVLLEHDRSLDYHGGLKEGVEHFQHFVGWLLLEKYKAGGDIGTIYYAAVKPLLPHLGGPHAGGEMPVAAWQCKSADGVMLGLDGQETTSLAADFQARTQLRFSPKDRILGRVIGWFRAPSKSGK